MGETAGSKRYLKVKARGPLYESELGEARVASHPPREAVILLARDARKLVYKCLGRMRKGFGTSGTRYWTVALELCCLEYMGLELSFDPIGVVIPTPTDGSAYPFRYCPHADQKKYINSALKSAKQLIGLDDEGAALAHISAAVLEDPDISDLEFWDA